MKRSKRLEADPDKVRDWQDRSRARALERARGREGMLSSALRATATEVADEPPPRLKRTRRKRKVTIPKKARAKALRRSEGLCVVCVFDLRRAGKPPGGANRAVQLHHVLPERMWPDLAKLAENLVGICPTCHARHENAFRRIPRGALPACVFHLAHREGLSWFIDDRRQYP